MNKDKKEITSAFTHLAGAIFGLVGLIVLLNLAIKQKSIIYVAAFLVFGLSMILLYSSSFAYHLIDKSKKKAKAIMRKVDHIMIFVLIAGTYTPFCLLVLDKSIGYRMLAIVWSITIIGAFIKLFWINAPRWVSAGLYLGMGWLSIFILKPLINSLPSSGIFYLVLGGILYTVGGIIYGLKKPRIDLSWFGFHELFHLFVLAGTFSHYLVMKTII